MTPCVVAFCSLSHSVCAALGLMCVCVQFGSGERHRRTLTRSRSPSYHRLSPTLPPSVRGEESPFSGDVSPVGHRSPPSPPPPVSAAIPRLGGPHNPNKAQWGSLYADWQPSPLLGNLPRTGPPTHTSIPPPPPQSTPSLQPYAWRGEGEAAGGPRRGGEREPHSFRHSVMARLKQTLTPASTFRASSAHTESSTSRAAFVAERVRRGVYASDTQSLSHTQPSPSLSASGSRPAPSPTHTEHSRAVVTSLADVKDATLRAAAAARKAEEQADQFHRD